MARPISWTAWILFFVGIPFVVAGHPCHQHLGRFLGWGWGSGYHGTDPNGWYSAACGFTCEVPGNCEAPGVPYSAMFDPAYHTAARYYVPPVTYPPYVTPRARTANAQRQFELSKPSTIQ